jgi:hypothetical protein
MCVMVDPVPLHPTMSEADYDMERARLRELYGDSQKTAGAKRDQALAVLFAKSGWNQERLAAKEGKGQQWISRHILFGRFLNFTPFGVNEELPPNLTEGRFRKYWGQTDSHAKDEPRFREVIRLIRAEPVTAPRRPAIGDAIKKQFADGQWHAVNDISAAVGADADHVTDTLKNIAQHETYGCKAERKRGPGGSQQWRLFKLDKVVSSGELLNKLTPIIKDLEDEGRSSLAAAAPARVAILAHKLRKLLEGWTQ